MKPWVNVWDNGEPWKETWTVATGKGAPGEPQEHFLAIGGPDGPTPLIADFADDGPRARLASAAPELVRLLLELEAAGGHLGNPPCCFCSMSFQDYHGNSAHNPSCPLDQALVKAGVRG